MLVIDTTQVGPDYPERVGRLIQSLNGENIKTDIYHVIDNAGIVELRQGHPTGPCPASGAAYNYEEVQTWAKDMGYVLLLHAESV